MIIGQHAPEDIPKIANFVYRFHKAPYIDHAIEAWEKADEKIDQLKIVGKEIAKSVQGQTSSRPLNDLLSEVDKLNRELTFYENDFSQTLGVGSRWLEKLLTFTLFFAIFTVEAIGILLAVAFNRNLSRSLSEINEAAKEIGSGALTGPIPVRSNDELGQLATTLNKMTRDLEVNVMERLRAENASQIKTLFLANMSHEIRTPLGVIIGLTEFLKDPEISWEDRLKYIQIIETTGRNLTRIINDILDISKVESGHLQIEKNNVNLEGLLQEISSMMRVKALGSGNHFEICKENQIPAEIFTDRNRLQQILVNLINNANKFTHNGEIKILYGRRGSYVYFDVKDNGIGISPQSQPKLFQYFSQIDSSSTRQYEGTGLGLALSKKIAQSLGGDVILLESRAGKGSTFRATIALESTASSESSSASSTQISSGTARDLLRGKKVLIVDDSVDNQLLIQLYLGKKGIASEFADDGVIAVNKALNGDFDLVLMDMQMPVMDGYTATKRLRESGFAKPIIALTAHAMSDDRDRCIAAGCNEYLTKPIESATLYKIIQTYTSLS
ncbi:MAG TPA: response regulator, partial [Bdellovibrio sp.]|nr:response regulator [Bdellovibrio sp.]